MILGNTGTSRVNGYLFVLERSLATVLPRESVRDVVREIDSHLRDRISGAEAVPDERMMLEIPIFVVAGFGLLFLSNRGARKFLGWWRGRRPSFSVTVRPAT